MSELARKAILAGATNRQVGAFMRRYGMRLGAARFVAGETLDEALRVLAELNAKGLHANTTLLGEQPCTLEEVGRAFGVTRERIRQIENNTLKKLESLPEAQGLKDCV